MSVTLISGVVPLTAAAHWLAIEGVQPAVPQNPTQAEAARLSETTPKGASTMSSPAAIGNAENQALKPQVKHILSKELVLYFDRVCHAVTDENNESMRRAAYSSLRNDPGLHQLLPYILQFISEKVTHGMKNIFILNQTMEVAHAILDNVNLFVEPYVGAFPPARGTTALTSADSLTHPPNINLSNWETTRRP